MLPTLPVLSIVFGAFGAVFRNLGALARASLLPLLMLLVIGAIEGAIPGDGLFKRAIFWVLAAPFSAVMFAAYHRIVLLGPESLNNPWCLYWTPRETGFLGWMLLLEVMAGMLVFGLSITFLMAPESVFGFRVPWLGSALAGLITLYIVARFSMVLPATALGKRVILSNSWYLTAGNGVWLTIVLATPLVIFVGLMAATFKLMSAAAIFAILPLVFLMSAVEVAALSLSYRFLDEAAKEGA